MSGLFGDVVNQAVKSLFHGTGENPENNTPVLTEEQKKSEFRNHINMMEEQFINETGTPSSEEGDVEWDSEAYDLEPVSDIELYEKSKLPPSIAMPSLCAVSHVKRVLLLYNPASGARLGEKIAARAVELLQKANIDVVQIKLEKRGHAEEVLTTYDFAGIDVVGVLGGDGTFHEAVNGMMKRKEHESKVPLAFIAGGTGNSFSLELQGGTKVERAIKHIVRGLNCPIDIGQVTFPKPDGTEEVVYSFNSMHWGLASKVNVTAEKLRWVGKAIRYTTAAMLEMIKGETTKAKVILETPEGNVETYNEDFCLIIVNNIVSAAKGMKMAPFAKLNDGLFDILLIRSNKTIDLVSVFRKIYDGSHILSKEVEYRQVKSFSVIPFKKESKKEVMAEEDPEVAEELVDIDGELKGATPFFCKVLPRSCRVII